MYKAKLCMHNVNFLHPRLYKHVCNDFKLKETVLKMVHILHVPKVVNTE